MQTRNLAKSSLFFFFEGGGADHPYIYIYISLSICICICICICMCICICIYIYTYTYTYIYTYIYIYISGTPPHPKIHACLSVLSSWCAILAYLFFMSSVCLSSHVNTPKYSKTHTHTHTDIHDVCGVAWIETGLKD